MTLVLFHHPCLLAAVAGSQLVKQQPNWDIASHLEQAYTGMPRAHAVSASRSASWQVNFIWLLFVQIATNVLSMRILC